MTKELLQQALDALELQPRLLTIDNNAYPHTVARDEVIHKLKQALAQQAHFEEQPDGTVIPVDPSEKAQQEQPANRVYLVATGEVHEGQETYTRHDTPPPLCDYETLFTQAQPAQEPCGCREGECETKKDKTCRMTIEIAERDGIPEWTPAIGIECAISSLRDDAARLRDGSYTPLQIADDLNVIANDLGKCNPVAQQEQPASVDAYVGAREDAAIWKKRALEAEELNRKFIADVNGPTYLGEPVKQEQPAQKVSESWTDIVAVNLVREGVNKHKARELAAHFLTLFAPPTPPAQKPDLWKTQFLTDVMTSAGLLMHGRTDKKLAQRIADGSARWRTELYTHPAPTQPALSDDEILNCFYASKSEGMASYMLAVGRAIEAHCRGGAGK